MVADAHSEMQAALLKATTSWQIIFIWIARNKQKPYIVLEKSYQKVVYWGIVTLDILRQYS